MNTAEIAYWKQRGERERLREIEEEVREHLSQHWLSVREAAQLVSLSTDTLYRAIAAGELAAARIGQRQIIRVSASALQQWMEGHQ